MDHYDGILIGAFAIALGVLSGREQPRGLLPSRDGLLFLVCFRGAALRFKGHVPGHPAVENILLFAACGTLVLLWRLQARRAAQAGNPD